MMDIKISYLSLRNKAKLQKLLLEHACEEKICHQEKLFEKYTIEQQKYINNI